jgi:hypothetical protein
MATFKSGCINYITVRNAHATDSIAAGDPVEATTNGVEPIQTAGHAVFGFAHEDIAAGDSGVIEVSCGAVYELDLASSFNPQFLTQADIDTAGKAKTSAGTAFGYVVGEDPAASAKKVQIYVYPQRTLS